MAAARPQLRGLLATSLKRQVAVCAGLSLVAVICTKVFVKDARIKRYEEFYKTYDADKEFERMRDLGVFRSVAPQTAKK